jgi:cell division protein FtsA
MKTLWNSKTAHPAYLYALDIGSRKLTLAAAPFAQKGSSASVLVETCPAQGVFKGIVNDIALLGESVGKVFAAMQARTGVKATRTAISINGNYVASRLVRAAMALAERGTRSISERDMVQLDRQARTLGLDLEEILLHEFPQGYYVDRHNATMNPLGLHGRKFETELLVVAAPAVHLENITKAIERAGLDITHVAFSGVAAGDAVLSGEDKEKGAVVVDIGDALSCVLAYKDGRPRFVRVLAFGGKDLVETIGNYCQVTASVAEEILRTSLEISPEATDDDEVMIKVDELFKPVKKKELAAVVAGDIDEFVATLKSVIVQDVRAKGLAGAKVVVTGGLSLLEGLLERMEQELGVSVKMGIPKTTGQVSAAVAPAYAAALGLLQRQVQSAVAASYGVSKDGKSPFTRWVDHVKHIYQDYF